MPRSCDRRIFFYRQHGAEPRLASGPDLERLTPEDHTVGVQRFAKVPLNQGHTFRGAAEQQAQHSHRF